MKKILALVALVCMVLSATVAFAAFPSKTAQDLTIVEVGTPVNGAVLEDDNETLRIYYGAGDYSTNLAFTTLTELWTAMTPCSRIAEYATVSFWLPDWQK